MFEYVSTLHASLQSVHFVVLGLVVCGESTPIYDTCTHVKVHTFKNPQGWNSLIGCSSKKLEFLKIFIENMLTVMQKILANTYCQAKENGLVS